MAIFLLLLIIQDWQRILFLPSSVRALYIAGLNPDKEEGVLDSNSEDHELFNLQLYLFMVKWKAGLATLLLIKE